MACFALVSGIATPAVSATVAGAGVVAVFACTAAPAQAEAVVWDANWGTAGAPTDIPDSNVISDIPPGFSFLSKDGSAYTSGGETVVRLAGTAVGANPVSVIGGAGATGADPSTGSEGPITVNTWMKVTGGNYATLVGGSYAQNYVSGEPASFTGDSHILLTADGASAPAVDYIIGGNYMDAQNAAFTGDSYISVERGAVNGSIVGGSTSAHIQTAVFNGNSRVWVYTPLAGTAETRFSFPGTFIVGGNAAINNYAPKLEQTGDSEVTVDVSAYALAGSAPAVSMEKAIVGGAWLLQNTTSTHTGNAGVNIKGTAQDGSELDFSLPVVAGAWFAGSGTATLSGNTVLNVAGGSFADALVGGAYLAADGEASFTMGNAAVSLNGGNYAGNIIGGSSVAAGSAAATLKMEDISISLSNGSVSGTIYGGSYSMRSNAESVADHGDISISLAGGSVLGNVYAGGGVAAGTQGVINAASTQVEVSNDVVLGSASAGITVSGGVQNGGDTGGVAGDRTLLLSGSSAYTNLDNATFYDFNVVNNASAATIKLQEADDNFTKTGAGALTINGADSDLNPVAELTVAEGSLNTGTAWLTRGGKGLSAITIGAGASLTTDGLALVDGAVLTLDVTGAASPLITAGSAGGLLIGGQKTLSLTLNGVDSLAGGGSATLLSWGNTEAEAPFELSDVAWTNKSPEMAAYELSIVGKTLVLTHAEELVWDGAESGTWSADAGSWEGQGGASDDKAVSFNTPTGESSTVTISGNVAPQSVTVDNAADTTYNFEADAAGGAITGAASLTKMGEGTLAMNLANTYTGGTMVEDGTLDAAAAGALGTGAVALNGGELLVSAADAVAANAVEFNGGSLRYTADETRNLNTAGITHAAGVTPAVAVAAGNTVSWQYSGVDGATALQAAMGEGISLSGGGTLKAEAMSADTDAALSGGITLTDEGTTLEFASLGAKQLGTADSPMDVSLGEGTTLRVERPQADAPSGLHASLEGTGTLEFANSNADAAGTVQLTGDNSAFAGAVNLGSADAAPAAAGDTPAVLLDYSEGSPVGGEDSSLNLNGLGFATLLEDGTQTQTAAAVNVNRNTTQYAQTAGLTNTFSGALTGAAGSTWLLDATPVDGGQTNVLAGDLAAFEGTLAAEGKEGSVARWQLGGEGASPNPILAATLSAADAFNEFVVDYAEEATLSGAVTGQANLTQQGAGTLVLTGDNDSSGTLSIAEGSTVQLGNADDAGQWGNAAGSSLAGAGNFNLVNGMLAGPLSVAEGSTPQIAVDVAAGRAVDMGGNEGSLITGAVTLGEGSTLTNVGSSILDRELNLTLATANVGEGAAAASAMVQFVDDTAPILTARAVTASLGSTTEAINLSAGADDVIDLLRRHRVAGVESYLTLTNGQLVTAADFSNVTFGGNLGLVGGLGLRVERVDGGSLVLSGEAQGVYIAGAGEDPTAATGYQNFGAYQAVAVMPGETLTLTLDGAPDPELDGEGATINNLLGAADSALVVNNSNTAGEVASVILNNSVQAIDPVPGELPGDPTGADTAFGGSIAQQGGDVEFVKTGEGTLSVGGPVTAYQLTAREGAIALYASGNVLELLNLEGGEVQFHKGESAAGSLLDSAEGGKLVVAAGATLATTGEGRLVNTQISGTPQGAGALRVGGTLELAENARLDGVALEMDGGSLVLDGSNGHRVSSLRGEGMLGGLGTAEEVGLAISGKGGDFSGSLTGNGTLTVEKGAAQSFGSGFRGGEGWKLTNNGSMQMDFVRPDGSNAQVTLNALTLGAGSSTGLRINTDAPAERMLTLGSISAGEGAELYLSTVGTEDIVRGDVSYTIGSVSGGQAAGTIASVLTDTSDVAFMLLDAERSTLSVDENGNLVLNLAASSVNKLESLADNPNSAAGAGLLWNAAYAGNALPGTDIRDLLETLYTGGAGGDANRILAAASGASAAVLSSAFASDLERQLRAIRNRTTGMVGRPCTPCKGQAGADGPRFNAWINGEGDHRKMKADGFLPGYSLTSWGGTLGVDMSCSDRLVGGLALSALYGDLKARSADHAEGDFDRYYLSAFARLKSNRWQHTLLGSVGKLDADLNRTVSYGTGSYRTHGSTDGWGYGLMYEIGYSIPMDEDSNFTLQPVANVSWRYVDVDGFREHGSDAALRVDGQDYNVVTFGAGFRAQAEVGERFFNRRALFEGRALVKVDAGDREGEAMVAMLGGGGYHEKVRSAKLEAVGVELGAGITFPLGDEGGAFFIDGSAELRNSYSNLNGTVGYRVSF